MSEIKFVDGMRVEKPSEKAPSFVIAKASFHVQQFKDYLDTNSNQRGYVNVDILESHKGTYYAKLNDFKADMSKPTNLSKDDVEAIQILREGHKVEETINADDIPF